MAKTKYEIEIDRAVADKRSTSMEKFTGSVRQIGINNLENGDIVTIPAGYKVFSQEIPGSEFTAEYLIAKVDRKGTEMAVRFYPSSFTKMGMTAVGDDKTGYTRGQMAFASGTVVDHVQGFADVNEAVDSLVDKPFKANFNPVNIITYEARDKETLGKDDVRKTNMPIYNF